MARKKQGETPIDPEALIDEALEETFPARDPISPGVGPGEPIRHSGEASKRRKPPESKGESKRKSPRKPGHG